MKNSYKQMYYKTICNLDATKGLKVVMESGFQSLTVMFPGLGRLLGSRFP